MVPAKPRLKKNKSVTLDGKTSCGSFNVTITTQNDKVKDIIIKMSQDKPGGGCMAANMEGIARSISIGIQDGKILENYAKSLKGITCSSPTPGGSSSCCDAIAGVLDEFVKEQKTDK